MKASLEELRNEERARIHAALCGGGPRGLVPAGVYRFVAPYLRGEIISVGFGGADGLPLHHPITTRYWLAPGAEPIPLSGDVEHTSWVLSRVPQAVDRSCAVAYVTLLVQLTSRAHADVDEHHPEIESAEEDEWLIALTVLEQNGHPWARYRRRFAVTAVGRITVVDELCTDRNVDRGFVFGR